MVRNKRRRSMLFVPAIKKHFLEKLNRYEPDTYIIDLEDSVDRHFKEEALANLMDFDKSLLGNSEFVVRVNRAITERGKKDLYEVLKLDIDSLMLPKVGSAEEIVSVEDLIGERGIEIIPIIETLEGYSRREEILRSSTKIKATAFGAEDFCMEAEIEKGDLHSNFLLNKVICDIVLLTKMLGIKFIDCVFTQYGTKAFLTQMRREAEYTRDLGAEGKLLIHPSQIEIANKVYAIDQAEIEQSLAILKAFDVLTDGSFTISVDNVMMDVPSFKKAAKTIEKARKYGYIEDD